MIFLKTFVVLGLLCTSLAAPAIKGRQTAGSNQRPFYGTKGGSEGAASGQQEASLPAFVEPPPAPAPEPDAGEPMMPYSFEYSAEATNGMSARREVNDGQRVTGSYMLAGPDGINRIVHYVADKDGFRATITTNEPGTESQSPAATLLNSSQLPAEQIALMYGPREPIPQPQTSARLQASPPIPALPAQIQSSPPAPRSAQLLSTSAAPLTTQTLAESSRTTEAQTTTTRLTSPAPQSPPAAASQSAPLRLLNQGGTKGAPIVQQQQTKSLRSPARSRPSLPPPPAPLVVVRAPAKAPPQRVVLAPPPPPPRPLSLPPPPPLAPALPRPLALPPRAPSKARPQPTKLNQVKVAKPFYIATTTTTTPPPPPLLIIQEQQQEQQQEEQQQQEEEQVQQVEQVQQQEQVQQEQQEVQEQQQQQEETQEQEQVQEIQQEQQEAQQSENRYAYIYY